MHPQISKERDTPYHDRSDNDPVLTIRPIFPVCGFWLFFLGVDYSSLRIPVEDPIVIQRPGPKKTFFLLCRRR
jgi:hypothetical protein